MSLRHRRQSRLMYRRLLLLLHLQWFRLRLQRLRSRLWRHRRHPLCSRLRLLRRLRRVQLLALHLRASQVIGLRLTTILAVRCAKIVLALLVFAWMLEPMVRRQTAQLRRLAGTPIWIRPLASWLYAALGSSRQPVQTAHLWPIHGPVVSSGGYLSDFCLRVARLSPEPPLILCFVF